MQTTQIRCGEMQCMVGGLHGIKTVHRKTPSLSSPT